MKRAFTSHATFALAAALIAGLALAAVGDSPLAAAGEQKLVLINEGEGAQSFALGDLADGESRTFKGEHGTVTVTRKGEQLEVTIEGEDGERTVAVTSAEDGDGRIVLRTLGADDEPRVFVMRHAGSKDGAVWTGEDGKTIEIREGDGHAVFVGGGHHRHGFIGEGGEHVTVVGAGDGFAWSTGGKEMVHFRCAEDDVLVAGPKDTLEAAAPSCPVCGKAMEKLAGAKHRTVQVKVLEENDGEKPQI